MNRPRRHEALLEDALHIRVPRDVALVHGVGVHRPNLAQARALLGPNRLVGVSCHAPEEIAAAYSDGADFALFGPVWDSPGKAARGAAALKDAVRAAPFPVLAIGGVTAETASQAMEAGAAGVACIRAVLGGADPGAAARELYLAASL